MRWIRSFIFLNHWQADMHPLNTLRRVKKYLSLSFPMIHDYDMKKTEKPLLGIITG